MFCTENIRFHVRFEIESDNESWCENIPERTHILIKSLIKSFHPVSWLFIFDNYNSSRTRRTSRRGSEFWQFAKVRCAISPGAKRVLEPIFGTRYFINNAEGKCHQECLQFMGVFSRRVTSVEKRREKDGTARGSVGSEWMSSLW